MIERGALLRAAVSCQRRRPLLALLVLLASVVSASAQEPTSGIRMAPLVGSDGSQYYLMVEYRGGRAMELAAGSTLAIAARRKTVRLEACRLGPGLHLPGRRVPAPRAGRLPD